jgi:hypothetical protein
MTFSLVVELVLSALLAATLVYCAILERRLATLRKGQDGLKQTFSDLSAAITSAGASIRTLKDSAASAAATLDDRLARARGMADELSVLTVSGERLAERMATRRSATPQTESARPARPAVLTNRIDSLRPDALRPEALRNVR